MTTKATIEWGDVKLTLEIGPDTKYDEETFMEMYKSALRGVGFMENTIEGVNNG
jgi:hypothetical protein